MRQSRRTSRPASTGSTSTITGGLLLLYLALLRITLSITRGLRRQVAVNASQAEQLRAASARAPHAVRAQPAADDRLRPRDAPDRRRQQRRRATLRLHARGVPVDEHRRPLPARDVPGLLRRLEAERNVWHDGAARRRQTRHRYKDGTIIDVEVDQRRPRARRARLPDRALPGRDRAQPRRGGAGDRARRRRSRPRT